MKTIELKDIKKNTWYIVTVGSRLSKGVIWYYLVNGDPTKKNKGYSIDPQHFYNGVTCGKDQIINIRLATPEEIELYKS